MRARCSLVGAGPGDPELLTLKALRAIRAATVLLVDDLVSDEIVALARRRTRIVRVGKRGGCRSTPQSFIERLMVSEALAGERVVRLKGGDPFVFGRGGGEAAAPARTHRARRGVRHHGRDRRRGSARRAAHASRCQPGDHHRRRRAVRRPRHGARGEGARRLSPVAGAR